MASLNFKHSFTYTPDAGKATALLGNSEKAYNQVWHLPTAKNPYTGREWIEAIAKEMGVKTENSDSYQIYRTLTWTFYSSDAGNAGNDVPVRQGLCV